ncbi:MAG: hypothetical protein V2I40_07855 [Desulfobacteraceae bacterium]|jgi:hypothetical protein|nr:hypothetical protein [Desulfobacteraceae bacterium]
MGFSDAIANALGVWFGSEYAETITYDGADISALVTYGGGSTNSVAETAVIEVKVSDVPAPAYRDAVVIAGETWRVYRDKMQEAVITGDGYTWKIPIKKDERPNFR